jgi:hypothetical protein
MCVCVCLCVCVIGGAHLSACMRVRCAKHSSLSGRHAQSEACAEESRQQAALHLQIPRTYTHAYTHTHTHTHQHTHTHTHTYAHTHTYIYTNTLTHTHSHLRAGGRPRYRGGLPVLRGLFLPLYCTTTLHLNSLTNARTHTQMYTHLNT